MKTTRYLSLAIAIAAIFFLVRPLTDLKHQQASSNTFNEQSALDVLSTQGIGLRTFLPDPYEPEGVAVKRLGGAPAGSHATRVALWSSSPFSGPVKGASISKFGVIEEGILYRSAQPTDEEMRQLLRQGIKSIVSFRKENGDNRDRVLGLGFENYLWLNIEDETVPTDAQAERFLDFVTDSQNWPVLIHCKVGVGRTGTMAALVRYAVDGWSMDEAIKESKIYRDGIDLVPSQLDWLKQWAANHPPACHLPVAPGP